MALRPETSPAASPADGPAWPVSTLTPGPQLGGPQLGGPAAWPTVDLSEAQGIVAPERTVQAGPGPALEPPRDPREPPPPGPAEERRAASGGAAAPSHGGAVASLQARSLGELVSGAVAVGFVLLFAASVVTAFAHVPGQGFRARLLVAFNYANFLTAVALLLAMVCLLLLGRSAARGGLAHTAQVGPLKWPLRDVLAGLLAAESALVGLGSLVSFVVYASLASSLPSAGAGHLLAEVAVLPVVVATLLWGWAGGMAKLKVLFGVGSPGAVPTGQGTGAGPVGPPPVRNDTPDED
jgi:hypothetical protein